MSGDADYRIGAGNGKSHLGSGESFIVKYLWMTGGYDTLHVVTSTVTAKIR
jgi:hypothetical protein